MEKELNMHYDNGFENKLEKSLLCLRLGVFLVMFMWTLDKFVNPEHALGVFEKFYFLGGFSKQLLFVLAGAEMLILGAFLIGYKKTLSYGFVLGFHFISTISSYKQYLNPWQGASLLFFAAWPMLAACFALFWLRDYDKRFSIT